MKNYKLSGIGVSPGISFGKAFVVKTSNSLLTGIVLENEEAVVTEIIRFDEAVDKAVGETTVMKGNSEKGNDISDILDAQIELLTDPEIRDSVVQKISEDRKNANDALIETVSAVIELFNKMDDEYLRARASDVRDIGSRISKHLNNIEQIVKDSVNDSIIIAEDISPSDTINMDVKKIAGFATVLGSKTSHAAIIAKSKGIPAIVGCGTALMDIIDDDDIIIDAVNGVIIINPDDETKIDYEKLKQQLSEKIIFLGSLKEILPVTKDKHQVKLTANISHPDDIDDMFDCGGEGVGLFRTELLFMNRKSFPSEDEQFEFYRSVVLKAAGRPVITRTIDIGGDKKAAYFGLPEEQNPFLGYRAIRICLDRKDIFITQLKAILRSGIFGNVKIMFPMISNVQELRKAKKILQEAKEELRNEQKKFKEDSEVGIMIEIPSAAVMADILAKEVDFFSIGTNDLIQYTLAVDRMNDKIKNLYDPFNPGVLRLIKNVIDAGHGENIHVGMCGEMASDPLASLLLLGLGLDEFSMSASSIPYLKNTIVNAEFSTASALVQEIMQMDSSENIINSLKEFQG